MSMQIIVIWLFGVWMFCPILLPLTLNRGNLKKILLDNLKKYMALGKSSAKEDFVHRF